MGEKGSLKNRIRAWRMRKRAIHKKKEKEIAQLKKRQLYYKKQKELECIETYSLKSRIKNMMKFIFGMFLAPFEQMSINAFRKQEASKVEKKDKVKATKQDDLKMEIFFDMTSSKQIDEIVQDREKNDFKEEEIKAEENKLQKEYSLKKKDTVQEEKQNNLAISSQLKKLTESVTNLNADLKQVKQEENLQQRRKEIIHIKEQVDEVKQEYQEFAFTYNLEKHQTGILETEDPYHLCDSKKAITTILNACDIELSEIKKQEKRIESIEVPTQEIEELSIDTEILWMDSEEEINYEEIEEEIVPQIEEAELQSSNMDMEFEEYSWENEERVESFEIHSKDNEDKIELFEVHSENKQTIEQEEEMKQLCEITKRDINHLKSIIEENLMEQKMDIDTIKRSCNLAEVSKKRGIIITGIQQFLLKTLHIGVHILPRFPFKNKLVEILGSTVVLNNRLRGMRQMMRKENKNMYFITYQSLFSSVQSGKECIIKGQEMIFDSMMQLNNLKQEFIMDFYHDMDRYPETKSIMKEFEDIEAQLMKKEKELEKYANKIKNVEEKVKQKVKVKEVA